MTTFNRNMTATWINNSGSPMAIASSAAEACSLWEADRQCALAEGRLSLEDFGDALPVYHLGDTVRVTTDVADKATGPGAPELAIVGAAAMEGYLYEYGC